MDIEHFRSHRQMSDRPHKRDCRLPIIAGTFFLHYSTEASRSTGGSGGSEPPVLREALVLRNSKRKSALCESRYRPTVRARRNAARCYAPEAGC